MSQPFYSDTKSPKFCRSSASSSSSHFIFPRDFSGTIIIIIIIHEYYYGGAVALLLQDHLTMSVSRFAGYKTCPGVNSDKDIINTPLEPFRPTDVHLGVTKKKLKI